MEKVNNKEKLFITYEIDGRYLLLITIKNGHVECDLNGAERTITDQKILLNKMILG